ncbi:hypothetical protein QTI19_32035 [Variovorax sp. J22R203]|uniref:hypothetical protein n=2 Tax=Variovorax TaxID=34072 RepID=UPI002577AD9C|nr:MULTISPECIES: hypothetical protein [unclassified Variovorax]MDM0009441.1 hypothetical protein [Variovorax sp. J22R203]
MKKERRTANELMDALLDFVASDSALFALITDLGRAKVVAAAERAGAANWTVRSETNVDQHRPEIARAIRELQKRFELAE